MVKSMDEYIKRRTGETMGEKWYRLTHLPDLTLNKYSSLEGKGVDGVLDKHLTFLRQLNRKGIVSGLSFHLYYLYYIPEDPEDDRPGHRLRIFFQIRGRDENLASAAALIEASPLAGFYDFESELRNGSGEKIEPGLKEVLEAEDLPLPQFRACSFLTKTETSLSGISETGQEESYFIFRDWEMNEDGRLYNLCNTMEALHRTALYRVDLYPVEKSSALRSALQKPMSRLRKKQDDRNSLIGRDYEGRDALQNYEDMIEKLESSPHFIANIMAFAGNMDDSITILDSAGSEGLHKGKYTLASFNASFTPFSFLDGSASEQGPNWEGMLVKRGKPGLIVCDEQLAGINLNYLTTLFTLEEIAPFFRFPVLYDGETIQMPKETAAGTVSRKDSLKFGQDENGYDVNFPLKLFPKHAFVSGVPGSGKTNAMTQIASMMWKQYRIPFLVLEPAKQEYRAILNDPEMSSVHLFSPNADMSFPLHINPFEMPKGTMVAEHIRKLCEVFEGAFPLENPMPFLLDTAIEAVYRENGWIPEHIYTGEETKIGAPNRKRLPTMSMLYKRLEEELKSTTYSAEVRGNLESALKVRIGSLLRREMGDVFDVPRSTFPPEKWLEVPALIELESMGTGPANFLTLMLCTLIRESLKMDPKRENGAIRATADGGTFTFTFTSGFGTDPVFSLNRSVPEVFLSGEEYYLPLNSIDGTARILFKKDGSFDFQMKGSGTLIPGYWEYNRQSGTLSLIKGKKDIRHVIFIEEAHNLIGPESEAKPGADSDPKQAATAFIVKMLAEVRALKEGIIIADQLPTAMAQEVLKNTGLKLGLRITSSDDRSLLGSTMAANGMQLEQMPTFLPGEALIFYEDLLRPFKMRFTEWCGGITDRAQKEIMTQPKNDADLRAFLSTSKNKAYIYENLISIDIIGNKYKYLKDNTVERIEDFSAWLEKNFSVKNWNDAQLIRQGKKFFRTEDEKLLFFDEYTRYCRIIREKMEQEQLSEELLDIFRTVEGFITGLERLKNGRWKRFGAPGSATVNHTKLETNLADIVLAFFNGDLQRLFTDIYPTGEFRMQILGCAQRILDLREMILSSRTGD